MAEIINRVAEVAKNTKFLTTESINVMSKLRLGRRLAFSPRLQSQCLIGGFVHIYAGGSMLQVASFYPVKEIPLVHFVPAPPRRRNQFGAAMCFHLSAKVIGNRKMRPPSLPPQESGDLDFLFRLLLIEAIKKEMIEGGGGDPVPGMNDIDYNPADSSDNDDVIVSVWQRRMGICIFLSLHLANRKFSDLQIYRHYFRAYKFSVSLLFIEKKLSIVYFGPVLGSLRVTFRAVSVPSHKEVSQGKKSLPTSEKKTIRNGNWEGSVLHDYLP
ncbi:hypothetical protein CEXT_473061 [Caerostris extrusa]|uniref:Uncharacterized protein n=1 Tax=Caerostris extrusa TaxID=172846 RepID=A0AAV4NH33_CAEEX|nr:hypothetical protein CEXT_473061 [Caerostris extrusa]